MTKLTDITQGPVRDVLKCLAFSKAGVAEGTNANTWKTSNTTLYTVAGVMYSKAATDNLAMTADVAQAASTTRYFALCLASGGGASSVAGAVGGGIPEVNDQIDAIARAGTTVTVTTKRVHGLTTNDVVLVRAGIPDYDGLRAVTVVDTYNFTYTIAAATGPAMSRGGVIYGRTPIGYIKVVTGATTFTPGSTDFGAANVTVTYLDGSYPESTTF